MSLSSNTMSLENMGNRGSIYVIAAPSGCGKSSLIKALLDKLTGLSVAVSHTSRAPRKGELNGMHYHFVNDEKFHQMLLNDDFIEHATVYGHMYGTSKQEIESRLQVGEDVLLDIDWQGARQIIKHFKAVKSIFLLPPSLEALKERLVLRGEDSDDVIIARMKKAQSEISHCSEFDYWILNEDFEKACSELQSIIIADRLSKTRQTVHLKKCLLNLLEKR